MIDKLVPAVAIAGKSVPGDNSIALFAVCSSRFWLSFQDEGWLLCIADCPTGSFLLPKHKGLPVIVADYHYLPGSEHLQHRIANPVLSSSGKSTISERRFPGSCLNLFLYRAPL